MYRPIDLCQVLSNHDFSRDLWETVMRTKLIILLALIVQAGCQTLPDNRHDRLYTPPVGMRGSNR